MEVKDKLDAAAIEARMPEYPEWSYTGGALQRTFAFEDFVTAMAFVNRIAELAEALQHHPDILVRYGKVTLTVSSHDVGGVTERDFALARQIDGFAAG